jgi:hypothetical protein
MVGRLSLDAAARVPCRILTCCRAISFTLSHTDPIANTIAPCLFHGAPRRSPGTSCRPDDWREPRRYPFMSACEMPGLVSHLLRAVLGCWTR